MTTRNQLQALAIKTINLLSSLDKDDVKVSMCKYNKDWSLEVVTFNDCPNIYSFYEFLTVKDNVSLFRKLKKELRNDI